MKPEVEDKTLRRLRLDEIATSTTNDLFRDPSDYTENALADLRQSIAQHGVIQPVLVRMSGELGAAPWVLISGERRYRASLQLGLKEIPAYVRNVPEAQALEMQIIENLQRQDVNPMKEAIGFGALVERHKLAAAQIAQRIGKSPDYVQERLRLTKLIPAIQDLIRSGELPLKAGLKMARIPREQQPSALSACTEVLHLSDGAKSTTAKEDKRTVFRGLAKLQAWMDDSLFTDLVKADFDKEDAELVPDAGACTNCPHRARNTAGLFNDITIEDKCLLASCYRRKQVATYKALAAELAERYPKFAKRIVFKERGHAVDGKEVFRKELSSLGEIKGSGAGEVITEAQAMKNPKAYIAILIGSESTAAWYDQYERLSRKAWTFCQPVAARLYMEPQKKEKELTPEQAAREEKRKEEATLKANALAFFCDRQRVIKILEARNTKNWNELLRAVIARTFDDWSDNRPLLHALVLLKTDWIDGKGKTVKAKDFDMFALALDKDQDRLQTRRGLIDVDKTIDKLDFSTLTALAYVAVADEEGAEFFGVDMKACKQKASSAVQSWWAKHLIELKKPIDPPTKKTAKVMEALISGKKKPGLKALLKKGGKRA